MPHEEAVLDFSAPAQIRPFAALLFDMDGTIIDSTAAVEKYWMALGKEIGVPGEVILQTSHGRRTIDTLAEIAPERANWDFVKQEEASIPHRFGQDVVEIPGSRKILDDLEDAGAPWAIVTSGTRGLIGGWLDVMKLAHPKFLVTAEDVANGKPDPACYRLGAKKLNLNEADAGELLVLEDAPAGVRAGKAAGFSVVALATTHDVKRLREAGADWIVRDMRSVLFQGRDAKTGSISIEIRDALVE